MNTTTDIVKREGTMPERSRQLPEISPLVDIYENDNEIRLYADMPGVDKKDIGINVDNGNLRIAGVRHLKSIGAANWEEFGDVEYRRSFSVPQTIDVNKVNAELKDGVLVLHLPKSEEAKPRQIKIH